jgi:hypothetical protein
MRYIKDGPFSFRGVPPEVPATTVGKMLSMFAGGYTPSNRQGGLLLTTSEIRALNKAEDVLVADPVDGYFALEDAEYEIIKRCIPTIVENSNRATSAPVVEDIIEGALTERPTEGPPKLYAVDGAGQMSEVGEEVPVETN